MTTPDIAPCHICGARATHFIGTFPSCDCPACWQAIIEEIELALATNFIDNLGEPS